MSLIHQYEFIFTWLTWSHYHGQETALSNSAIGPIIQFLNQSLPQPGIELDVTRYPNPFFGVANSTFIDSAAESLRIVGAY